MRLCSIPAVFAVVVLILSGMAGAVAEPGRHPTRRVCADPLPHHAACHAIVQTDTATTRQAAPGGYGPADLRAAYRLPSTTAGSGQTVAIVDAYDLPTAESDLATYRAHYGLPPCTTANGCFRKVNQSGGSTPPAADPSWGQEIALDLDMVSAVCPNCRILLVEANSNALSDLGKAVNTAVSLGARYVSNSYGGPEFAGETTYSSSYYNHPGVAVTASSGDEGYGAQYPAASRYVTAVGGTSLIRTSNSRGWLEPVWSGAGAGCSSYEGKPAYQRDSGCTRRTIADVSAVSDPQTGVAVYDSTPAAGQSGWLVFGGTSVAAPIIAATYALAGTPPAGSYPSGFPYAKPTGIYDVTSGSDGACAPAYLCSAATGYDGPSGMGTPSGTSAFNPAYDPIEQHYANLGGAASYLGAPVGTQYGVAGGSGQDYQYGSIFYSSATGAWAMHGLILQHYPVLGGPGGVLGFPTTDELGTPDGVGRYNHFAGGGGGSIYWTPNTGARSVHGAIRSKWASLGWETGVVGYPVTDESGTPDGTGRYNHFAGGDGSSIYWTPSTGAWSVHGAIRATWAQLGWERSALGYPTSDEYGVAGGRRSDFAHGYITWYSATGQTQVTYYPG